MLTRALVSFVVATPGWLTSVAMAASGAWTTSTSDVPPAAPGGAMRPSVANGLSERVIEPESFVDAAHGARGGLPGGYFQDSAATKEARKVGEYVLRKVNCLRARADPPCEALSTAHVIDHYYKVTEAEYVFGNVTLGGTETHAVVLVDKIHYADDLDCPELAVGDWGPYTLIKLTKREDRDVSIADSLCDIPDVSPSEAQSRFAARLGSSSRVDRIEGDVTSDGKYYVSGEHWEMSDALKAHHDTLDRERTSHKRYAALGVYMPANDHYGPGFNVEPPREMSEEEIAALPSAWDSRIEFSNCSATTPGSQSYCGSCWAFASTWAYSYRLCALSNGAFNELISPQHFVSCDWGGTCDGGFDLNAFSAMNKFRDSRKAMVSETRFPYTQPYESQDCVARPTSHVRVYAPDMSTVTWGSTRSNGYLGLRRHGAGTEMDSDKVIAWAKSEIMRGGAIIATVGSRTLPTVDKVTDIMKCAGCTHTDHEVILVGWGERDGVPYWIMQNSWSSRWMDGGFGYIRMGQNDCCIEGHLVSADPDFTRLYDPDDITEPTCFNGGEMDLSTGLCRCPPPWRGTGNRDGTVPGCDVCGIDECANGGNFDADNCVCTCTSGFAGPECKSTIELESDGVELTAIFNLGEDNLVDSDITLAYKREGDASYTVITGRGEICGGESAAKENDHIHGAVLCTDENDAQTVSVIVNLLSKDVAFYGEDVEFKFVQFLGYNEFGQDQGYDVDYFGATLGATIRLTQPACDDIVIKSTLADDEDIGTLTVTLMSGPTPVGNDIITTTDDHRSTLTACLPPGFPYSIKLNGEIASGPAQDRFSVVVTSRGIELLNIASDGFFDNPALVGDRVSSTMVSIEDEFSFDTFKFDDDCGTVATVQVGATR